REVAPAATGTAGEVSGLDADLHASMIARPLTAIVPKAARTRSRSPTPAGWSTRPHGNRYGGNGTEAPDSRAASGHGAPAAGGEAADRRREGARRRRAGAGTARGARRSGADLHCDGRRGPASSAG